MHTSWLRRARPCFPSRVIVLSAGLILCGCAGIRGVQQQVTSADLTTTVCPTQIEIAAFSSSSDADRKLGNNVTGMSQQDYRNAVINNCITAANNKFAEYTASFRQEGIGTKLGVDLAILTLSGLGAVGESAQAAAAATQGLVGAGAAINKNIYFDQTMPALISAMGVNRNLVLNRISENEKKSAQEYSLRDAGNDFWALQNASSIDGAINQMISLAKNAETVTAGQELPAVSLAIVEPKIQERRAAVFKALDELYKKNDRATLDKIAAALKLPPDSDFSDAHTQQVWGNAKGAVFRWSLTDMDALAAALFPILGKV